MIIGVKGLFGPVFRNNITKFINKLNSLGVDSREFVYPPFGVFHTYNKTRITRTSKLLYDQLNDGDSILCHSFGGVITTNLINEMHKFSKPKHLKNIYMFNPAVNTDIEIDETYFDKMYIFYDPKDKLLRLAKWLPFNSMGSLGKYGYPKKSKKIKNIKLRNLVGVPNWHSEAMIEPNLTFYSKFIKRKELEHVS